MDIVGLDNDTIDPARVHTIDVWYSARSDAWFVERLNREGQPVGIPVRFTSELDAVECVSEWLRAHTDTHLSAPLRRDAHRRQVSRPRRRAA